MEKKQSLLYRSAWHLVRLFYPKTHFEGLENIPEEASVFVGNHSQAHGPIIAQLYFPVPRMIWCAGQMMHKEEIPDYAYEDFWGEQPRWSKPFFRLLSYVIASPASVILSEADTIAVYRDTRIISTFKKSIQALEEGKSLVIYPEHKVGYNQILCQFQENYLNVAKLYYKQTGKALLFVPMYLAPRLKTVYIGKPIRFDASNDIADERRRVTQYLMDEISRIAVSLPEHKVVPYVNLPRRFHNSNHATEAIIHEKTGG